MLIRTAQKTKKVKKIIRATIIGEISISPKETMNKKFSVFINHPSNNNNSILDQIDIKA